MSFTKEKRKLYMREYDKINREIIKQNKQEFINNGKQTIRKSN